MTYSQFDPAARSRLPWNFGAKIGPKRPFHQKQIWAIRFFLDREERVRDRALFDLAIWASTFMSIRAHWLIGRVRHER